MRYPHPLGRFIAEPHRRHRLVDRSLQPLQLCRDISLHRQGGTFALDPREFLLDSPQSPRFVLNEPLECRAPRRALRHLRLRRAKCRLGNRHGRLARLEPASRLRLVRRALFDSESERRLFLGPRLDSRPRILHQGRFPCDFATEFLRPPRQFGNALLDALFLAIERIPLQHHPLHRRSRCHRRVPQSRYRFGRFRLLPHQNRLIQRPCGNLGIIPHHLVAQRGNGFFRVIPLPEQNHRLDAPDLRRKRPITLRLARLPLQPVGTLLDLTQNIINPRQVRFSRLQPQFRFLPPPVQPRNPGRILQNAPPRLRLGRDNLADLPLPHHGRRARACCCIRKQ